MTGTTFVVTAAPFKSWRDGKCYVITRRGCLVEHVQVFDEADAAKVLAHTYGVTVAVAKRRIAAAQ